MLLFLLVLCIFCAVFILFDRKAARMIIFFGVFSLITSLCYMLLGGPDIAMAEAAISAFVTFFFIVCIERYYRFSGDLAAERPKDLKKGKWLTKVVLPFIFSVGLFGIFVYFVPTADVNTHLKEQFLLNFLTDVGGENNVTAIYLGYRVYDTLFEALILVISVVAVTHLSWTDQQIVKDGHHSQIENYPIAIFTLRIICPVILIFGIYLILNGHLSPGGGFQGGLAVASFFVCRYMIYGIFDMPIKKMLIIKKFIFVNLVVAAVLAVFLGVVASVPTEIEPISQVIYLMTMNSLIGLKVACGFFVLFYHFIAIERQD